MFYHSIPFNNIPLVIDQHNLTAKTVNAYIVYDLENCSKLLFRNFIFKHYLFCATNIGKNSDKVLVMALLEMLQFLMLIIVHRSSEEKFSINFSEAKTGFCLSLHYNGDNSYFFDNGKRQIIKMSNKFDSEKCQVTKNIFKRKCVYFFSRL